MALILITPSIEYARAFQEMAEEFQAMGELRYDRDFEQIRQNFSAYLLRLERNAIGEDLPAGYVPQEEFWLVDTDLEKVIGVIRLRRLLTPRLKSEWGQVGYSIRPSARRKGYGTRMLAMLLERLRAEGRQRVLITCDADNVGSRRIIEANGGLLENQVRSEETGKSVCRYWITL